MSGRENVTASTRREQMARRRESKRPSRAGIPAGTSEPPPPVENPQGSAFLHRLGEVLEAARSETSVDSALERLVTLDGDLSRADGLRALDSHDMAVFDLLSGPGGVLVDRFEVGAAVFVSEVGLDEVGRVVITSPLRRFLDAGARRLGVAFRIAWTKATVARFESMVVRLEEKQQAEAEECRTFLRSVPDEQLQDVIGTLRNAMLSVPPVQVNRGRETLSNLRDETNLTGKTLSPHSPQCYFTDLEHLPLRLWSDDEVVVIASLWITYLSGGAHRIESLNGAHVDLDRVWDNFRAIVTEYERSFVDVGLPDLPSARPDIHAMRDIATALNEARTPLVGRRALAHRIVGATRAKREFALPEPQGILPQEAAVLEALRNAVPGAEGCTTLEDLRNRLRGDSWLISPHAAEPTGLEAIISRTVRTAVEAFRAEYALSRGLRDYPKLVHAVRTHDFEEIIRSELPAYYCCVVPSRALTQSLPGGATGVADLVWSMSARMQYNTWHVLPGNLPQDAAEQPRDYFAPQTLPDIADNMHLFHRGHLVSSIRHTLRSPERIVVAGQAFHSLTDLRLVRTRDESFTTLDLAAVIVIARFLADCLQEYAVLCEQGSAPAITSFDSAWHRLRTAEIGERA